MIGDIGSLIIGGDLQCKNTFPKSVVALPAGDKLSRIRPQSVNMLNL